MVEGTGEIVAESACASNPSLFWADCNSSANCGDVWASAGELRSKLWGLLPVIALAGSTDSIITRGFEDRDTSKSHEADQIADLDGVFLWDCLLVVAVGIRNDLWKSGIWLRKKVLVIWEIRLVLVVCCSWLVEVGDEGRRAAGDEFGDLKGMTDANDGLDLF